MTDWTPLPTIAPSRAAEVRSCAEPEAGRGPQDVAPMGLDPGGTGGTLLLGLITAGAGAYYVWTTI
ncbi:hypothetical protein ACRAWD_08375 [Caulobacter segnis]